MNSETTTPDTPALTALDAHKKWKEMCTNMIFLERQVLRMMAHPDATPEQVLTCKRSYAKMLQDMQDTLKQLQERYPRRDNLFSPAWRFESLSGYVFEMRRKEK